MKKTALPSLVLALVLPAAAALAQPKMDDMKPVGAAMKPAAGVPMAHKAMGTVKNLDAKTGLVTLAHGPVKTMNWPAMTMAFKVKDKMLLDKLGNGRKVEIELMQDDKDYVITGVR